MPHRTRSMRPGRRRMLAILALAALDACQSAPPVAKLSARDAADIARIEGYLDGVHTLTARVVQTWPNGAVTPGTAWLERPGRLRIQYDRPRAVTLVVAGGLVVSRDLARNAATSLPLSRTPLGILLAAQVRLSGEVTVTDVQRGAGTVQVSMIETRQPAVGSLALTFTDSPLRLLGVDLLDARGEHTRLRLANVQLNMPLHPDLFEVAAPVEPRYLGR